MYQTHERLMHTQDYTQHSIFANNPLLGEALLFRLALPPEWRLAPGVSHPEVFATHERGNKVWVVSGAAWYVIYQANHHWALELAARITPSGSRARPQKGDPFRVSQHPAWVVRKTQRRGLPWKRHDVSFVTAHFTCPVTERNLVLEFSGWCPAEGFQEVLEALAHLGCH